MHLVWIRHCLQGLFSEAHRSSLPCRQSRYCHSSTLYNIWFAFIICFIQTSNAFNECVTAWFMPNILNLLQFQLLLVQKTCSSVPWPTFSKYCYCSPCQRTVELVCCYKTTNRADEHLSNSFRGLHLRPKLFCKSLALRSQTISPI